MKFIYTLFCIALFTLIFSSCEKAKATRSIKDPGEAISVKVIPLSKQVGSAVIHTSGQFTTNDETFLSFKTGGIINSVTVKEGEYVKKGQLLASLDMTEINAQVAQAKLGLDKAKRDYQRTFNLYKDSVVTLEQLENSKTGLDLAEQQFTAANFNLNFSQIRAISDGYILKKFVNPGQLVSSGTPVFQTNGAGKSGWVLKAGVSDKEWSAVKIGDKAVVKTDVSSGMEINAIVARKSEGTDPVSGSFTVDLKLTGNNLPPVAAGLFGKATITPSGSMPVWTVPYQALLEGNGGRGFVFVTNDLKTARRAEVEIASMDKDKVYLSKGLDSAAYLIVEGSPYLKDHSVISVVK